jgi:hypothetical protein
MWIARGLLDARERCILKEGYGPFGLPIIIGYAEDPLLQREYLSLPCARPTGYTSLDLLNMIQWTIRGASF